MIILLRIIKRKRKGSEYVITIETVQTSNVRMSIIVQWTSTLPSGWINLFVHSTHCSFPNKECYFFFLFFLHLLWERLEKLERIIFVFIIISDRCFYLIIFCFSGDGLKRNDQIKTKGIFFLFSEYGKLNLKKVKEKRNQSIFPTSRRRKKNNEFCLIGNAI